MKRSLLALALILAANNAFAAGTLGEDNRVEINLKATVARSCFLDFNDEAAAEQKVDQDMDDAGNSLLELAIQLKGREAAGSDDREVTVRETCNEDYQVSIYSANGGLALDLGVDGNGDPMGPGHVHAYKVKYTTSTGEETAELMSSDIAQATPHIEAKLISDHDASGATSPFFKANVVKLSFPKAKGLPKGEYTDVLALEMGEIQ